MLKDVVDKRFKIVKEYPGSQASLAFAPGLQVYMLTVESDNQITEGLVHRAALDLGVIIIEDHITSLDNIKKYIVKFPED